MGRSGLDWKPSRVSWVVADQIEFTGFVPDDDLPKYYAAASCYVHTGLEESFGLSVVEAAYCGCPVVAVDEGGVRPNDSGRRHGTPGASDLTGSCAFGAVCSVTTRRRSLDGRGGARPDQPSLSLGARGGRYHRPRADGEAVADTERMILKLGRSEWWQEWGVLAMVAVCALPLFTPRVYASDEIKYFSTLRSIYMDRDLHYENEYAYFIGRDPVAPRRAPAVQEHTDTHRLPLERRADRDGGALGALLPGRRWDRDRGSRLRQFRSAERL